MKEFVFALISMLCGSVYALDAVKQPSNELTAGASIICPSQDFSQFISSFVNDVNVQRAFTKFPLKKIGFKSDAMSVSSVTSYELSEASARFPLIPSYSEIRLSKSNMRIDHSSRRSARAVVYNDEPSNIISYEFAKTSCWNLVSIEDRSITRTRSELINSDWLERTFPAINDCAPYSFYYDPIKKRTNNGILEKRGYSPYSIENGVAKYRIKEKFYGFAATELWIPSGTLSIFSVIVIGEAIDLSNRIYVNTGMRPDIYGAGFNAKYSLAYLIQEKKDRTSFVCFSSEE